MESTVLLTVVGVAAVMLVVILTGLCLNCKGNSQPTFIRQQHDQRLSNSYPSNQGFTVVRPYVEPPSFTAVSVQPSQHHHITSPSMPDTRRTSTCPSSDEGSQSYYINQNVDDAVDYEQPPEKTPDYPDYLDVLPDDQNVSQQNLASSVNSGQSYQNIDIDDTDNDNNDNDSDSQHYINVNEELGTPENFRERITETPVGSIESYSSDDHDSSDYVNAPNALIQLGPTKNTKN